MKVRPSGAIWRSSARRRSQIVRRVCERLESEYGRPRLGNPRNALDDLVYIILSNRTTPETAHNTYKTLKVKFKSWDALARAHSNSVRAILVPAGLSRVKCRQIKGALKRIESDFGRYSLAKLKRLTESEVESYFKSLPGVSDKVAKCVMLYTMEFDVLPVDTHVHRICLRLGWTSRKRADQCHEELEALVPPKRRYAFHVDCIAHGRAVCLGREPNCQVCCIKSHCPFNASRRGDGR